VLVDILLLRHGVVIHQPQVEQAMALSGLDGVPVDLGTQRRALDPISVNHRAARPNSGRNSSTFEPPPDQIKYVSMSRLLNICQPFGSTQRSSTPKGIEMSYSMNFRSALNS